MEQTRARNALEPFLALTKSASSPRAAADLITRASSAPNTYIFAELLLTPQIQSLSTSSEYSSLLSLLKIFSYGTYTDYRSTPSLPTLNEAQTLKLRQLSLLSLAKNQNDLTYKALMGHLGLETARELENLVISAIYAGLITATLDPYHQIVLVSSVSPLRDLQPNSIPQMLNTLNEWSTRCVSTLADLERQITVIKAEARRRYKEEEEWAAHVEKLTSSKDGNEKGDEEKGEKTGFFSGMGQRLGGATAKRGSDERDSDEAMDIDDDEDGKKGVLRSSKKRGLLGGSGGK